MLVRTWRSVQIQSCYGRAWVLMATDASLANRTFYEHVPPGRHDYWRKMAACRHRVDTLVKFITEGAPRFVIDLGCGDGSLLHEIRGVRPQLKCAGVDLSEAQIAINRADRNTTWVSADLDGDFQIPELNGRADAVVASEVIEHLDHPDLFLRAAGRLVIPTGRLYLSTQSGVIRETERRVGHRRHFSGVEMQELLVTSGWRPIRIWNTGYPFHDLSKWFANIDPGRSIQNFGEKAYGVREDLVCWALRQAFRLNSRSRGAQLFAIAEHL